MDLLTARVLVIENDTTRANLIRQWLDEPGYDIRVLWETHVRGKLSHSDAAQHDAVILDLGVEQQLPYDTLEWIESTADRLPILVLSAYSDLELGLPALRRGAMDFLTANYKTQPDLVRALFYAIERRRSFHRRLGAAFTDVSTGLYNRAYFVSAAERHLSLAARRNFPVSLVVFQLANPSDLYVKFDDLVSEALLPPVADELRESFRNSDLIARIEPNHIAILANEADSIDREVLRRRVQTSLRRLELIGYFGYTLFRPENPRLIEDMLQDAYADLHRERMVQRVIASDEQQDMLKNLLDDRYDRYVQG